MLRRAIKSGVILGLIGLALVGGAVRAAGTNLVASVVGGGIQFDGNGFYPGELVQIIGIHYDGSTVPYGPAPANNAGAITGTVPYKDPALYQIDARGYVSGNHAVSNIAGALPYPIVPPGYPYVTPTYPDFIVGYPNGTPIAGGYANTGYPYTGSPYGGPNPGPGFGYPVPPSGVVLYPYGDLNGTDAPTFIPSIPYGAVGSPVVFTGGGWAVSASVSITATAPDGTLTNYAPVTTDAAGNLSDALTFSKPGTWHITVQASGMSAPVSATVQIT